MSFLKDMLKIGAAAAVAGGLAYITNRQDDSDGTDVRPECPDCGSMMNYDSSLDAYICPECDYSVDREDLDEFDDYEEYYDDDFDDDDMPDGCKACGGPWPKCQTSCKMYDD